MNKYLTGNRFWLARLHVALSTFVIATITITEPLSLSSQIITRTGPLGWACVMTLAGLSLVCAADVVVNDLLPDKCVMPSALRWRHLLYMLLALGLVSITFVIASVIGFTTAFFIYWLDAVAAVFVAFATPFCRRGQQ